MPSGRKPENKQEGGSKEEQFSFLQETVKQKPAGRQKIIIQLTRIAVCGVLFGFFACFGFFALKPWVENTFYKDKVKVMIPVDEEEEEPTEASSEEEVLPEVSELDASSYEDMMQSLYGVAEEAKRSVVSIQSTKKGDWAADTEYVDRVSGVIVADNGRELLVAADNDICENATEWIATTADRQEYAITLKKQDKNRGLAVFSIAKNTISSSTSDIVKVATLGNSNGCRQGQSVIALGEIFGDKDDISYGIISSKSEEVDFDDGRCGVISTDIPLSEKGSGILVNLDGAVLGLIRDEIQGEDGDVVAKALAISNLKTALEKLVNGESVPYFGANGLAVNSEISQEQSIPEGVYITRVQTDSPAMMAGIQNGDVIQELDEVKVTGIASFDKAVEQCKAGDIVKVRGQRRGNGGYVEVTFDVTIQSKE